METKTQNLELPCNKCRFLTYASLHDNMSPHCGLPTCRVCSSMAQLNDEIAKAHSKLSGLVRQRQRLKFQLNHHHQRPLDLLPFELISKIFVLCIAEDHQNFPFHRYWSGCNPVSLGAVCRRWRDITLQTPQLWTMIKFTVKYSAPPDTIFQANEWLHRSGSLPLSIMIDLQDFSKSSIYSSKAGRPFAQSTALLKFHSIRWHRISIRSSRACHIHNLLSKIRRPPVDLQYLTIEWCRHQGFQRFDPQLVVLSPNFISLSESFHEGVGIWDLPCGFNKLTSVDLSNMPVDEILYFIRNAPNLEECVLKGIENFDSQHHTFALPTTPIMSRSITVLETGFNSDIFSYLMLPSLRELDHECVSLSNFVHPNVLATFFERSSPPHLSTFNLAITRCPDADGWYEMLPAITSLSVDLYEGSRSPRQNITQEFLAALARTGPTIALPNLQSLSFTTDGMTAAAWSSLCAIYRDYPKASAYDSESTGQCDIAPQVVRGQLKEIHMFLVTKDASERLLSEEGRVFDFFESLKKYGIELTVRTSSGPNFGETQLRAT